MRLLFIILITLLSSCSIAEKSRNTVVIAVSEHPIKVFYENGKLCGYTIDVIEEISRILDIHTSITVVPKPSTINAVTLGKADAAPGLVINEERKKHLDFSRPYDWDVGLAILFKEEKSYLFLEDFKDKKIAVVVGSYTESVIRQKNKELKLNLKVIQLESIEMILQAVKSEKVDAGITNFGSIPDRNIPGLKKIIVENTETTASFGVKKGNSLLLDKINYAIQKAEEYGALSRLHVKWYGY